MSLLLDGVLALGQSVPQLDRLVTAGRHDLPVVRGEGHREDVLGVILEPPGGLAGAEVPQSETLVPGAGESEVSIRGEDHVRNKVTKEVNVSDHHDVKIDCKDSFDGRFRVTRAVY